jgi:hypothetical protein
MKNIWTQTNFTGGISEDTARGIRGSFAYGEQIDFRTNPESFTGVYAPTKNSTTVIAALPKWICQFGTDIFCYAGNGHIYKKETPWTDENTNTQTGVGNGMAVMGTILYYAADAKLGKRTAGGVYTDNFQTFTGGATNAWHPMKLFSPAGGLCIGDGRYIATMDYDGVTFTATDLTLPLNTVVKCLEVFGDYLVIGTYEGTNVYDNNIATLYFWDGTSSSYNFKLELNESGIHALQNTPNGLMIVAGVRGNVYMYNGGSLVKIFRLPTFARTGSTYNEVYPGAIAQNGGVALIGVAGAKTDTASKTGVFSWGTFNKNYPNVPNLDYFISTATKSGTTCLIGAVSVINDNTIYIGWRDGASYGVDLVSTSDQVSTCLMQTLYFSGKTAFTEKMFKQFYMTFSSLRTGESITLSYRKDSESSFTTIGVINSVGEDFVRFDYSIKARSIQFQITLAGTNNTLPSVDSICAMFDDLELSS